MTNRNYYTLNNRNRSTFGGIIYNYDFEGYNSMSNIVNRIMSDKRFDEQCKKNAENRDMKLRERN